MHHTWPAPLKSAIRELAEEAARQPIQSEITPDDAQPYCDEDVLCAFWAVQRATGDASEHRADIFDRFDESQHAQFDTALVTAHALAMRLFRDAMVEHVSAWLAREAEKHREQMEPTEADLTRAYSYAHEVDDPIIGDRRALARGAA